VPIVEPEILTDGTHSIAVCEAATQTVLAAVYKVGGPYRLCASRRPKECTRPACVSAWC
jgi:hypothetical protein